MTGQVRLDCLLINGIIVFRANSVVSACECVIVFYLFIHFHMSYICFVCRVSVVLLLPYFCLLFIPFFV